MSTHTWLTAETDNESDSDGEAGGSTPAKPGPIRWLTADTPPSSPHSQSALLGLQPPLGVLPPEGNRVPRSYSAQPPPPPEFDVPNMEMGLAARLERVREPGRGYGLRLLGPVPLQRGDIAGIYRPTRGMRRASVHYALSERNPLLGEYAMTLRRGENQESVVLYATPGDRDMGCVNESLQPNVTFVEVDVDDGDNLGVVLACVALQRINPSDFLTTDYGTDYESIRKLKGYSMGGGSALRRSPEKFDGADLQEAMCRAFGEHNLSALVGIGGAFCVCESHNDDPNWRPGRARGRTRGSARARLGFHRLS